MVPSLRDGLRVAERLGYTLLPDEEPIHAYHAAPLLGDPWFDAFLRAGAGAERRPPAAAATAQTAPAAAPANAVAATVNGQPIPETAVQRSLQRVPPAKQAEARPQILNFLDRSGLLDQYLLQQKIVVDPKEIDKSVDEIKAELKKENKEFAKVLEEMKLTEAELREHIAADIRWGKFAEDASERTRFSRNYSTRRSIFSTAAWCAPVTSS